MEIVPEKDYCPVEPPVSTSADDKKEIKQSTTVLIFVALLLFLTAGTLGYLILLRKKDTVSSSVSITPTTTISQAPTPTVTPDLGTVEGISQEIDNTQIDDFDSELQGIEKGITEL